MAKGWLFDGRTIAWEIKTSGLPSVNQVKEYGGANWECPQCGCRIDDCHVSNEWPGLPSGVKFDPSDVELLDHLAAKCGVSNDKPQEYIDIFIPTLDEAEGICYQHPGNLPGARKDGNCIHFFYRTTNAYNKGQRKRRKINNGSNSTNDIRWHKTGKTKAIFKNGVKIGFKKIMVLYETAVKGSKSKPSKMNWVMHQYHLGTNEDEKEGEFVVSKIFYQAQKQIEMEESETWSRLTNPSTPNMDAPDPPRPGKTPLYEDVTCDYALEPQVSECFEQKYHPSFSGVDAPAGVASDTNTAGLGTTDHENLDLGSSPHFNLLADLYFPCEDHSFCGCLDWL